jgi:hypothetical protein
VLLDNGGDTLTVTASGSGDIETLAFATALENNATYAVTVGTQPAGEICAVANGTGTVAAANVTNISVVCAATPA